MEKRRCKRHGKPRHQLKYIRKKAILVLVSGNYSFYNHFAPITKPSCRFFKTFDTKLYTVIICNTGSPMFKTLHIAFIYLEKPCICRGVGSKCQFIMKYHRKITLDHPHTRYLQWHCLVVSTIIKYGCSKHTMQLSLWFYTCIHHWNRLERKGTDTAIINQNCKIIDEIINSQQDFQKTLNKKKR